MANIQTTIRDALKGVLVDTGELHTIVVPHPGVDVIEMEDVHFHYDSSVILPWRHGENTETSADEDHLCGLSVIVAALRYAKDNSGKELLLAGHADSSGGADYNRRLSKVRAEAAQALLKGDKDAWGTACMAHQRVEDLQLVLKWVAEAHGWPCQPGAVDNVMGRKTRAARRAFRRRYNDEFSGSLPLDGDTAAADWKAIFDVYDAAFSAELGDDLAAARSALVFHDPAILACGEDFSAGADRPEGMRSASDRRVDLLFLDTGEPYPNFFDETPKGRSIYAPMPFVPRRYLPVDPPVQLVLTLTAIEGLYKPGFVADGDVAPKASGYKEGYLSDDDKGRIFVNHQPRTDPSSSWDDAVKKDIQFIELVAEVTAVSGEVPPDARVEWEWFDPNDPAHPDFNAHGARVPDEVDVDGNPRSLVNRGKCDYPSAGGSDMARFAQAGGLGFADGATINLSDTEIKDGESRVRLHVSNVAGDNFVVRARMKNSPRIAPSGQRKTGVMTVWKRIDVEYVRMAGAFPLPVDKVPPFFEPARVQMDFAPERPVASRPFLTVLDKDESKACAFYASRARGQFRSEGKPGWFFLAAAERASSENHSAAAGAGPDPDPGDAYEGPATVRVVTVPYHHEELIVNSAIAGKVDDVLVQDTNPGPHAYSDVSKKIVSGGKTYLHTDGVDYQSDFEVPHGRTSGLVGGVGEGGAYDKQDFYMLRHRLREPSGAFESGGMGFAEHVYIHAERPGATETTGLSPSAKHGGREYFAGRLLIFTRAFGATEIDDDQALSTIVHEFTHAFGYPHKCGYYAWPQPPTDGCSMNYFSNWIYQLGTRQLQRFKKANTGIHLCSKHLAGVREVNLEDNPAIWRWT